MLTRSYIFFLILVASFSVVSAESDESVASVVKQNEQHEKALAAISNDLKLIAEHVEEVDSSIAEVDESAARQAQLLRKKLDHLEEQLIDYEKSLEFLKTEGVNQTLGMNFSVWTGILLASVSAIVTTLGVVIAIGSVFGYKKIMSSSRDEAERVARGEANLVAKEEIADRINRGEFNTLVMEAVDRVAFGNINSNGEFDEKGND